MFKMCTRQGYGTAIEGWVLVPRAGGVRKGWQHQWLVVGDGCLSFYARLDGPARRAKTKEVRTKF
jgi:hypothetical protein